jgi:hypothetical protein
VEEEEPTEPMEELAHIYPRIAILSSSFQRSLKMLRKHLKRNPNSDSLRSRQLDKDSPLEEDPIDFI